MDDIKPKTAGGEYQIVNNSCTLGRNLVTVRITLVVALLLAKLLESISFLIVATLLLEKHLAGVGAQVLRQLKHK